MQYWLAKLMTLNACEPPFSNHFLLLSTNVIELPALQYTRAFGAAMLVQIFRLIQTLAGKVRVRMILFYTPGFIP